MKKPLRIMVFTIAVLILIFFAASCSAKIKPVQSDSSQLDSFTDSPIIQPDRESQDYSDKFFHDLRNMETPVFDDKILLVNRQYASIVRLKNEIMLYRQVYGRVPDSISVLVNSGFLLYWPRNPLNGNPVKLITGRDLARDDSDFGSFKYDLFNDDEIALRYISLDKNIYRETNEEVWIERVSKYCANSEEYKGWKYVMGGTIKINEVMDHDEKQLFAMCANFNRIIFSRGSRYYSYKEELPKSFGDILFNDRFFIQENLQSFVALLEKTGTDLRWGCDYLKNAMYITCDIGGERYIEFRADFGEREGSLTNTGFYPGNPPYNMDELDMSSPIVTSENIGQIIIPDEYMISINDIPLGGD